jgi:hypothetical protein
MQPMYFKFLISSEIKTKGDRIRNEIFQEQVEIQYLLTDVGFEVLTAVIMKSTIFCDITLCSPLNDNQRFGGTYRLHLQGRRIS